jgi:ABC-2 type transport system permease protein
MNLAHLRAFVWLRYRLLINQVIKGGTLNIIILTILAVGGSFTVLALTFASFLFGWLALGEVSPIVLMLIWDGVAFAFAFAWSIGLLSELQRSEALSVEKFLHLPVSLAGVFGLNYLSSLFSFNLIVFLPIMLGFWLGLMLSRGLTMLLVLPLILAYLLMVTALSYQFQGWLASLMIDKRRRRTVIMAVTLVFVLVCQLPSLINILRPWDNLKDGVSERSAARQIENRRARDAGEITLEEFHQRQHKIQLDRRAEAAESKERTLDQLEDYGVWMNVFIPIGWLPLGVMAASDGNALPALFGIAGYTLIGGASLWRAYRTTLRLYTGQYTSGSKQTAAPTPADVPKDTLLDRTLPWIPEQASIVALAGFRSLLRAPESKMLLLTPMMMLVIFGGMFFRMPSDLPVYVRPLLPFSGISLILVTLTQWVGNQFGFDRAGFRVFVLSPAPRREILLGKNLAVAPIALSLCVITVVAVQVLFWMRADHFLAMFPQMVTMYLLFCTLANLLSIYAPMAMAAGTMKPANTKMVPFLLNMLFMLAFSMAMAPTMLPFGVEAGLDALGWVQGVPIALPLSILICAGVLALYRIVLTWQGTLLQAREQTILEVVTTKAE